MTSYATAKSGLTRLARGAVLLFAATIVLSASAHAQTEYPAGPKPMFELSPAGELVLTNVPVPKREPKPAWVPVSDGRPWTQFKLGLRNHSALYRVVRARSKNNYWVYRTAIALGIPAPLLAPPQTPLLLMQQLAPQ